MLGRLGGELWQGRGAAGAVERKKKRRGDSEE